MKLGQIVLVVILSCITAFGTSYYLGMHSAENGAKPPEAKETAFDRIVKTNTLRCGYAIATPWLMMDPTTDKLTGVDVDVIDLVAKKIGVKIDWVEETGWGVAEQGLMTGRYDMLCGSVCIDPRRNRAATYSVPFLDMPFLAVVRMDDTRFDNLPNPLKLVNDPNIRIGLKDGHISEFIVNEQFPQAQKVYGNDISDDTDFLEMLKTKKVDVAFSGQSTIDLYNEHNPDSKVKSIGAARFCNGAFMMPLGDSRLKDMMDNAIMELNSSGQLREILTKWMKTDDPNYVRAPAKPYGDK
jgi:L-cystine transport system substrate-binding protein